MNSNENVKYFDLHTTGIGYLNRVRQVYRVSPFPWGSTVSRGR